MYLYDGLMGMMGLSLIKALCGCVYVCVCVCVFLVFPTDRCFSNSKLHSKCPVTAHSVVFLLIHSYGKAILDSWTCSFLTEHQRHPVKSIKLNSYRRSGGETTAASHSED